MSFTELNSVEHYIIHQLSGENLNDPQGTPKESYAGKWQYQSPEQLQRSVNEVLLEEELKAALLRLNPEIQQRPELAEEVIYNLRDILISVNQIGLVRANEEFFQWMTGEKTMPFGENNRHVPVRLIDFELLKNNSYTITNQFRIHHRETKIPDLVFLINGIPVVVGEAKTPIRPSVSWLDGAHEIHSVYENAVPQLFVPNIFSFATEGKELFYGAVRCPLEFWSPWRITKKDLGIAKQLGLAEIGRELVDLLSPVRLLDMMRNFSLFTTNHKKQRMKVIPRFQQYEGTNKIVDRVIEGQIKKGLLWHFQGSGKSLLMVFAAQKLRRNPLLKSPTVIVLVDRTDLDTQISGTFNAADIPNVETTDNINELRTLLEQDTRKIIISMIHKFRDAKPNLNTRENIIVLVDEAHRTQEGDLGRQMRAALPNAFLFGLTGTPVNKVDKNTFWAFGAEEDRGGYLSRYTFQDSIRDNATLPLHFEPRLVDVHVDKETIDIAFEEFKESAALTDEEADALNRKSAKMAAFLKAPKRVSKIVEDIARHFKEKVEPQGFKAMIVTPDRYACVQYKEELDKHFPAEASCVVISTTANDDFDFKKKWALDKGKLEKVVDEFNDSHSSLKFLIVTAKLLTGFDSPILQTMYLDKSLKDHTLLQAICRTNRLYPHKTFGCIVDYFGVFDDAATALEYDEAGVDKMITNLSELRGKLPEAMKDALSHFPNVDRTIEGFEGLEAAQNAINTNEKKDAFANDFKFLSNLWESLSPDAILDLYTQDYRWLAQVYESVKPASDTIGKLLWLTLGAQTTKLIHENIHVGNVHVLDEFVLDADIIDDLANNQDPKKVRQLEKLLIKRFQKNAGDPKFKSLSERLEELRKKAEQGLISSIEFVKELCKLAKETVQAEKEYEQEILAKSPQAALTELFLEIKTDQTPAVVARIVADIDAIVRVVRFPGWQTTTGGEREVQKSLRKALLKYKLHTDQVLFDRAYAYIKEYY
ncbi:type I restriction endonuclease subunit R [Leptospira sp. 2 VSF19]|uniref:Type I restriction enzyme endonuclease subunit n=1 Tax=Leptospira soteropolitanensis TaxID=2950025 RepID=A0AAW5VPT5_9LEPT|nr:type I restriction endonuclease subunit R [Leptospira soteropolitanensis]MCW7493561.1 type I restriction endonuclease subunit R [Leptospira soteropolitanensis]MCW7500908.1 type I restriction endonuclease subunit R [Leptospira soteropolitanensis]MCW7523412.1 type I restriction endonuclease subunit R [Leptospira soteropolitanensis]MCW7527273.1 type I restriction endonuclease subunit R [Leptospira soteropolitanensis]MCW7531130.1 type I restriction endonuclease subunit R [Leptospira soteropolit